MNEETIIIGILGIIGGIYKLYNDYKTDRLNNQKSELELDKEQQEHIDEMYNKIMELQKESIENYEKYRIDNNKLLDEIKELKRINEILTNKLKDKKE